MRTRSGKTKSFLANLTAKAAHMEDGTGDSAIEEQAQPDPVGTSSEGEGGWDKGWPYLTMRSAVGRPFVHYNPDNVRVDPDRCRP